MYSYLNLFKLLPPFFNDFFIFSKSIKKTTTRHTPIFYTYKTRLKIYTSSIKYTGPKIWDQLIPEHLKNISTLNSFKCELKLFLLTNKLDLDLNTVITWNATNPLQYFTIFISYCLHNYERFFYLKLDFNDFSNLNFFFKLNVWILMVALHKFFISNTY